MIATFTPTSLGTADRTEIARIYEAAIPAAERKPSDQLLALADRSDYRIDVARAGPRPAGFAVWFLPPDAPFALLEYLAVDESHRGLGLGASLFREVAANTPRAVLCEVETDDPLQPDDARRRRLSFYRRLGCKRVRDLNYLLPLRTAEPPPPMQLMIRHPDENTHLPKPILAHWLGVIYHRVYGQPQNDPRIEAMIAPVSDPVTFE